MTRTRALLLEVISLAFQLDLNVPAIDKSQLNTFQVIFCVASYFYFKSCNYKQAKLFIFFGSECRAALGTSSIFEQGSLLHQVSVVSSSPILFLSLFLFVFRVYCHVLTVIYYIYNCVFF